MKYAADLDGEIVQVVQMLKDGDLNDRRKSYRNKGMCRAAMIGNVKKMNT